MVKMRVNNRGEEEEVVGVRSTNTALKSMFSVINNK